MTFIVFLSLFLIFSLIGKLCLGKPDKPEFKTISWLAMLFSTGDGSLFYGITEPMTLDLTPLNAKLEANAAIWYLYYLSLPCYS
ncbi:BCCT family transporter [Staphylococcus pseudintermedius]|nr:BCCT family transporter [Staphylococcus pseudintermedius]EHT8060510.1 BCCT family transporter [Staphylococcus pseudintermedius]